MKVLHVTQGYYPAIGGTEYLIQRVSEELIRQFGDKVTVFTTNCYSGEAFFKPGLPKMPIGIEEINGVRVRRFPVKVVYSQLMRWPQSIAYKLHVPGNQYMRAIASGPVIPGLKKALKEETADVIAASSFPLLHMYSALDAAYETQRPCVLAGGIHPVDAWGFNRAMMFRAIGRASRYIAYTDYEADFVTGHNISRNQIEVIGVGVDPEQYAGIDPKEAKRRYGLENYPVVGFIGQISWAKGVSALVKSMRHIWKVKPEVRLLIAGARTIYCDQLEKLLANFGPEEQKKIILKYNFDNNEKPWLFSAIDVLAYPSGFESFGISFLEAWAAKKPVVGCRLGAVPWVVEAGIDGLLVDFLDDNGLAQALLMILGNPEWASMLGEAGYKKMMARYTWAEIGRRFHRTYENALGKKVAR
jgi:glycosyltransferase involved in cell wall biosynthesis